MKSSAKNLFKILCIALFSAISALMLTAFYSNINTAKAEDANHTLLLPLKSEEYYALNSPIHAYSDIDITAITESTVLHILQGDTVYKKSGRSSLNQVKRVKENLYFNDYSMIYRLPLTNLSGEPQYISLTGTYFDINENYIVTIYESIIQIYKSGNLSAPYKTISNVQNKPIAINSQSLFYVSLSETEHKIVRRSLDEKNFGVAHVYENTNAFSLSFMIADEEFVYFLAENKLYRLPIEDLSAVPTELTFADSEFDLGNVSAPKGLAFKNGNLLITDYSGSVQEYAITGDTLEFTGYAVASGLTAYNRVASFASDIERYGKYVAALDNNKLTVIDTENIENYNKDGFINKFVGVSPARFALGNGTIAYTEETEDKTTVKLENVSGENQKTITETSFPVLDISYQSGTYYIAYSDGTNTLVVEVDEKTGEQLGDITFSSGSANITAADVFKNVYVADNTAVYKYVAENGRVKTYSYSGTFAVAKKLCSDLAGNLFVLSSNGKIYVLDEKAGGTYSFKLAYETSLGKIKTFGLNFDKKETCFLIDGKEEIYLTAKLNNASLDDVLPNSEFNSATTIKAELKAYTAKNTANAYSVQATETAFKFNGLIDIAAEYPLIAKLKVGDNLTLFALAADSGVVLINEKELTEKTVEFTAAPEKVFITTAVSAYAIPMIDRNGSFELERDGNKIRISIGTEISTVRAFSMLNRTFYEAQIAVGETTVDCYIPQGFTTETLSEDLKYDVYEIETVKSTAVYKNEDLTDELFTLSDGDKVKVIGRKNGVLKVLTGETVGYISEKSVKTNPNAEVRNVLIIVAVLGSLAGTVSYFLLRKKK